MADYNYAAAQATLARKRKLAELLQQQTFQPVEQPTVPGAKLSPWTIALKALSGGLSGYMGEQADKASREDAESQSKAFSDLLENYPKGTPGSPEEPSIPGTPGQQGANEMFGPQGPQAPGGVDTASLLSQKLLGESAAPPAPPPITGEGMSPPMLPPAPAPGSGGVGSAANLMLGAKEQPAPTLAPPPGTEQPFMVPQRSSLGGTPMIPGKPAVPGKEASPEEWMAYGGKFLPLGPEAAKFGEKINDKAMGSLMEPGTKKFLVAGNGDVFNTDTGEFVTGPGSTQKQNDARSQNLAMNQIRENQLAELIRNNKATSADRQEHYRLMEKRKAAGGGGAGGSDEPGAPHKLVGNAMFTSDGAQWMREKSTGKFYRLGDNEPYVPKDHGSLLSSTQAKAVDKASANQASIDLAESTAKAMEEDAKLGGKSAYSFGNRTKNAINNATGGWMYDPDSRLTSEQQNMMSDSGRLFSVELHELFGAALTDSELKSAAQYNILPGMSAGTRIARLRGQAEFRRQMLKVHPQALRDAAVSRQGPSTKEKAAAGTGTTRSLSDIQNDPKYK